MRNELSKYSQNDPRINYRGNNASRVDNLTDAVFGIAITLLIFNLSNPNSFTDLLTFTKTLPAFMISISFLILVWREHLRFSLIYSLNNKGFIILNTIFIALVIFYVYPLRFLSLFLTSVFFKVDIGLSIQSDQVPHLMIYYGFVAFALYFILFLFYHRADQQRKQMQLNPYEIFYTKSQKKKLIIMFSVPLLSIVLVLILQLFSTTWASIIGGFTYALYAPAITIWLQRFNKKSKEYSL